MRRLMVAYLLSGETAERVNGLRRAYDPRTAAALPAHLTLAGPVNTPAALDDLVRSLRTTAVRATPIKLRIGAAATFLPVSSTTFLVVEPRELLTLLHDTLAVELGWSEAYPYHPHVTVTEYLDRTATEEAYRTLREVEVHLVDRLDRMTLLEKQADGTWNPVAELLLSGEP